MPARSGGADWLLRAAAPVALFFVVVVTHCTGVITSYDSIWSIPVARSLLREGNTDLDEYPAQLAANGFYGTELIGGHYYSIFPIGPSLVALPVVYALDAAGVALADGKIERMTASIVVGLTAVLLYLLARRSLGVPGSLLVALIFAFGTAAWSTATRALWQHGPSMLMLTLGLWIVVLARDRPRLVQLAALPLAFSYVIRPTNAIAIVIMSAVVWLEYRRYVLHYLLWGVVVAVPLVGFNWAVYHSLLSPYYLASRIGHSGRFAEASLGTLASPGRGLFVFSPILLLSLYGMWLTWRRGVLDRALSAIVLLHWIALSSFPHWWGGHSFGPRLLSDVVPYLIYFLIPVVARIASLSGAQHAVWVTGFACLVAISFLVNFRGATARAVYRWNAEPVDIDVQPSRLWDWRDLQFLRRQ